MKEILIYSSTINARLEYIAGILFNRILDLKVSFTQNPEDLRNFEGFRLNYSGENPENAHMTLRPVDLLFEKDIHPLQPETGEWHELKILFPVAGGDFPFDILAGSFYLVSRYEEYLPFHADIHERFEADQSMAFREGFLRMPLVNRWADEFKEVMRMHYPKIEFPKKTFRHLVTIDVDVPFAFLDRSLVRTTLSVGKDLVSGKFKNIRKRVEVLRGNQPDPFDTYHFITSAVEPHGKSIQWFWHTGNYGHYDKSLRIDKPMVREAIQQLAEKYPVGIHPSYQSFHNTEKLHEEIDRLKEVLGQSVTQSRQHYLRISFPSTYRNLLEAGIQEDYSMGYASEPGFRASICTPFPFYDLKKEEATPLMIFPFLFMDGTFTRKKMDDREMEETITYMSRQVRQTGGFFSGLWHNSTFGGEDSYRMKMFFERIVSEC